MAGQLRPVCDAVFASVRRGASRLQRALMKDVSGTRHAAKSEVAAQETQRCRREHATGTARARGSIRRLLSTAYGAADWAGRTVLCFGIIHVVTEYIVDLTSAAGPSMIPTVSRHGDLLVFEKIRRWLARLPFVNEALKYQRGDVVILCTPDKGVLVCKRIIAVEGDVVEFCTRRGGGLETLQVPTGHVWVQGDNPSASLDSRDYGCVSEGLLLGKVLFRIWPPWRIAGFPRQMPA